MPYKDPVKQREAQTKWMKKKRLRNVGEPIKNVKLGTPADALTLIEAVLGRALGDPQVTHGQAVRLTVYASRAALQAYEVIQVDDRLRKLETVVERLGLEDRGVASQAV